MGSRKHNFVIREAHVSCHVMSCYLFEDVCGYPIRHDSPPSRARFSLSDFWSLLLGPIIVICDCYVIRYPASNEPFIPSHFFELRDSSKFVKNLSLFQHYYFSKKIELLDMGGSNHCFSLYQGVMDWNLKNSISIVNLPYFLS